MLSQYKLKPHYEKHKTIPGPPQSAPNKILPAPIFCDDMEFQSFLVIKVSIANY